MSAVGGLGEQEVPLYVVSVARPVVLVPNDDCSDGVYCLASVRHQHRLAAALFQRDFVTCAVLDARWPYRLALPVYVQGCTGAGTHALTVVVVQAFAALRVSAVQRALSRLLADYYAYVGKCTSLVLYLSS